MNQPIPENGTTLTTRPEDAPPNDPTTQPLRRKAPHRRGSIPQSLDPIRDPLRSTTAEDIERADGEGMCPVPPPRPHIRG